MVVCQFGVMFFPDKARAFSEARRVLHPGGHFIFNVWDRIEENEFADTVTRALATLFPEDPPQFMARVPHGYHDVAVVAADLARGGFTRSPTFSRLPARSRAPSPSILGNRHSAKLPRCETNSKPAAFRASTTPPPPPQRPSPVASARGLSRARCRRTSSSSSDRINFSAVDYCDDKSKFINHECHESAHYRRRRAPFAQHRRSLTGSSDRLINALAVNVKRTQPAPSARDLLFVLYNQFNC